jgi:hypothetical protein
VRALARAMERSAPALRELWPDPNAHPAHKSTCADLCELVEHCIYALAVCKRSGVLESAAADEQGPAALGAALAAWVRLFSAKQLRVDTEALQLRRRLGDLLQVVHKTGLCPKR